MLDFFVVAIIILEGSAPPETAMLPISARMESMGGREMSSLSGRGKQHGKKGARERERRKRKAEKLLLLPASKREKKMRANRASLAPSPPLLKKKLREPPRRPPWIGLESRENPPLSLSLSLLPRAMLSPTFRSSDSDGHRKKPSLDHGRLQAALFAATGVGVGVGADHASSSASNPPPPVVARITSDDEEDDDHERPSAAGAAATSKASSRRGRAPAFGAAE